MWGNIIIRRPTISYYGWLGLILLSLSWYTCIELQSIPYVVLFGGDDIKLSSIVGESHLAAYVAVFAGYMFAEHIITSVKFMIVVIVLQVVCAFLLMNMDTVNKIVLVGWSFFLTIDVVVNTIKMQSLAMLADDDVIYETALSMQNAAQSFVWAIIIIIYIAGSMPTSVYHWWVSIIASVVFALKIGLLFLQNNWYPYISQDQTVLTRSKAWEKLVDTLRIFRVSTRTFLYTIILPALITPVTMMYQFWISFYLQPSENNKSELLMIAVCGLLLPFSLAFMSWINEEFQAHAHIAFLIVAVSMGWICLYVTRPVYVVGIVIGGVSFVMRFIEDTRIVAILRCTFDNYMPNESIGFALFLMHLVGTITWHAFVVAVHYLHGSETARLTGFMISATCVFVVLIIAHIVKRYAAPTKCDNVVNNEKPALEL